MDQQQPANMNEQVATEVKSDTDNFWNKFSSIPIVHDGLDKVQSYANANPIGRYAMKSAETTWSLASNQVAATPYAQAYLKKADALGCKSLELLEQRFPAVCQPTDHIVDAVKRSPQQVYHGVRGRVRGRISTAATPVHQKLNSAMDHVESLVDRWLPEENADNNREVSTTDNKNAVSGTRLHRLANRVSHRIVQRMPHSKADLARLAETNRLLQDTTQHITKAHDALQAWVNHSRQRAVHVQDQLKGGLESTRSTANARLNELSIEMIARLDAASAYLKSVPLPTVVRERLEPLIEFAGSEYDMIRREAMKPDVAPLQKATNILQMTHARVLPMLHESMESIQEQLRYYTVYAHVSRNKVVDGIKVQLHGLGIPV